MATNQIVIDGERKAVLQKRSDGNFEFLGLLRRSEWEGRKAQKGQLILTQRALIGATLHVESLAGQLPTVGTLIPAALLDKRRGQFRTGEAMDAHLSAIAAQRKADKAAAKTLKALKAAIL